MWGSTRAYQTRTGDVVRLPFALEPTTWFERPGTSQVWIWSEDSDALLRLDLASYEVKPALVADSVDLLNNDELVVGVGGARVYRYSLADGAPVGASVKLGNPSDRPAPYRLAPN